MIQHVLRAVWEWLAGPAELYDVRAARRHRDWPKVREAYLEMFPACQACGSTDDPEVHHKVPVHEDSARELDRTNLMHLCGDRANGCHYRIGHNLNGWDDWNEHVEYDAPAELKRLGMRRYKERK